MMIEDIARNANARKQTDVMLLDFSKAFDKVNHSRLLWRLHKYGIRGKVLSWIQAFLGSGSQRVVIDGEESDSISVGSVVPQGSVLGPILFPAYINDLPDGISSQVRLFADGAALCLTVGGGGREDGSALRRDLGSLSVWEKKWDMQFNTSKCQVVQVTGSKSPIKSEYILHGRVLETVTCARHLGVDIRSNISWTSHIDRVVVVQGAGRSLGCIRRGVGGGGQEVGESAYKTLVRPQLEYASAVWGPQAGDRVSKVEMVQRRAARWTISNFDRRASVTGVLGKLGWRTLEQRRADARLCLFYKIVCGLVAVPLPDCVQCDGGISRCCHSVAFRQVSTSTDVYKYSFFPFAVVRWSALPGSIVVNLAKIDRSLRFKLRKRLAGCASRTEDQFRRTDPRPLLTLL